MVKLTPSIRQYMILDDLVACGYFSSFTCTISSTLLIVYRIYNSLSNGDNHSKKRFIRIVDVLVQSAAAYALALMVVAIGGVVLITSRGSRSYPTVPLYAVLNYEGVAILYFVSVCTFWCTNTGWRLINFKSGHCTNYYGRSSCPRNWQYGSNKCPYFRSSIPRDRQQYKRWNG